MHIYLYVVLFVDIMKNVNGKIHQQRTNIGRVEFF